MIIAKANHTGVVAHYFREAATSVDINNPNRLIISEKQEPLWILPRVSSELLMILSQR